uniref:Tyrosine specific protein phosphatases domain-containing protein n=1 Tax=Haptolina brevifila TaxID=156173 RepID=A0A7S2GEU6_9EUKA|mmetsp:Transcript_33173/g.66001  ORF Transcript_33173/g.66001 Transcript_33173/m.66001 type:complete len:232 (+) Transcript_33173:2-697(+)
MTSFAAFREFTGWKRPGRDHGCKPVEIVPGLWTAHYHDIDSVTKLKAATNGAPIKLVVNSALCQCEARQGFYGPGVKVMEIVLEDDPDPRKYFDQGKQCTANCTDPSVSLINRFPGEAIDDFTAVSKAVDATLASGGHALIHCHASLSRSVAFILAHLMRTRGLSLLGAAQLMKPKWDAVWPCDRFVDQLRAYEAELAAPHRFSTAALAGASIALAVASIAVGIGIGATLK